MGAGSMFGQLVSSDPADYAPVDGYTLKNRWLIARTVSDINAINESFLGQNNYARTATIYDGEVLVAKSVSNEDEGASHIYRFDLATGESKGVVNLTLDGAPYYGLLTANNIGVDDYGHLWICGYVGNMNVTPLRIYLVNLETGELTALPVIDPAEAGETATADAARFDYFDIIGDLTGEECSATVMSPMAESGNNLSVFRAIRQQGSEEFEGGFDGFYFWDPTAVTETCPMVTNKDTGESSPQATWGTAPFARMINDEEHLGETFYIDGNTTAPAIYNTQGGMTDSFNSCLSLAPKVGTNGVAEFTLGENNFFVWSVNAYDSSPGCLASVGTFGDGFDFADLKVLYTFPAGGLGEFSDGGTRIHCLQSQKFVDDNGKEAVYILDYKNQNGLGVYVFAEEGFIDPNGEGGVEGVEEDLTSAPAVYYNLQGQKIANPAAGLYIVKRGNKVAKEMVY